MHRVIKIGNKDIPMTANAATPIRYRQLFHKNLLPYFMGEKSDEDAAEMVGELAYIMASSAAGSDMNKLSFDGYLEWLEGFNPLDFVAHETVTAIVDLYQSNETTQTESKKNPDQPSDK